MSSSRRRCTRPWARIRTCAGTRAGGSSAKWRVGASDLTSRRAQRIPGRYDLSVPENQRKLEAADALAVLADKAGMSLPVMAVAWVINHPSVTSAIIGPRTMDQLTSQLGAADVVLEDDVLDAVDEVVPPGTNFSWADAGYTPPSVATGPASAVSPSSSGTGAHP